MTQRSSREISAQLPLPLRPLQTQNTAAIADRGEHRAAHVLAVRCKRPREQAAVAMSGSAGLDASMTDVVTVPKALMPFGEAAAVMCAILPGNPEYTHFKREEGARFRSGRIVKNGFRSNTDEIIRGNRVEPRMGSASSDEDGGGGKLPRLVGYRVKAIAATQGTIDEGVSFIATVEGSIDPRGGLKSSEHCDGGLANTLSAPVAGTAGAAQIGHVAIAEVAGPSGSSRTRGVSYISPDIEKRPRYRPRKSDTSTARGCSWLEQRSNTAVNWEETSMKLLCRRDVISGSMHLTRRLEKGVFAEVFVQREGSKVSVKLIVCSGRGGSAGGSTGGRLEWEVAIGHCGTGASLNHVWPMLHHLDARVGDVLVFRRGDEPGSFFVNLLKKLPERHISEGSTGPASQQEEGVVVALAISASDEMDAEVALPEAAVSTEVVQMEAVAVDAGKCGFVAEAAQQSGDLIMQPAICGQQRANNQSSAPNVCNKDGSGAAATGEDGFGATSIAKDGSGAVTTQGLAAAQTQYLLSSAAARFNQQEWNGNKQKFQKEWNWNQQELALRVLLPKPDFPRLSSSSRRRATATTTTTNNDNNTNMTQPGINTAANLTSRPEPLPPSASVPSHGVVEKRGNGGNGTQRHLDYGKGEYGLGATTAGIVTSPSDLHLTTAAPSSCTSPDDGGTPSCAPAETSLASAHRLHVLADAAIRLAAGLIDAGPDGVDKWKSSGGDIQNLASCRPAGPSRPMGLDKGRASRFPGWRKRLV